MNLIKQILCIILGHEYVLIYENDQVQILRCRRCGRDSVGYLNRYLLEG